MPARGPALYAMLHEGLPLAVYDNLAELAGMEKVEMSRAVAISRSTLRRRAIEGRFTLAEGDRLYRFAKLLGAAINLFEGDRKKAGNWMVTPTQGLEGIPLK